MLYEVNFPKRLMPRHPKVAIYGKLNVCSGPSSYVFDKKIYVCCFARYLCPYMSHCNRNFGFLGV